MGTRRCPIPADETAQSHDQATPEVLRYKDIATAQVDEAHAEELSMEDAPAPSNPFPSTGNWTSGQLKLAFHLYCQTQFGKLHSRNPQIIELAKLIGRTPDALAMKLVNFASLDPSITDTGRHGLGNASKLDRDVWNEFNADWEGLVVECDQLHRHLLRERGQPDSPPPEPSIDVVAESFEGETRLALVKQRIKQRFFRRAVLSSYRSRCCISGLSDPRLLVASHIVPWSADKANRLNPSNGLCLSAIHDKAFDSGLIAITNEFRVLVSRKLLARSDSFVDLVFKPIDGQLIEQPERFLPHIDFIIHHREHYFVD